MLLLPPSLSPTQIQRVKNYLYTCTKLSKIECSSKVGRIIEQAVGPPTVEEVEGKMCSTDWHQCNAICTLVVLDPLLSFADLPNADDAVHCRNLMLACLFCSNCDDNRVL